MKKIIVALPTCGKTYACKALISQGNYKAVDYDLRGSKSLLTDEVRNIQTAHVKSLFNAGCDIVFTHNGAVNFELLDPNEITVDVVIRDGNRVSYSKFIQKRGDSERFVNEAYANYDNWVDGMWKLFDTLCVLGFKTRVILLGRNAGYIWDYLSPELNQMQCDC